MSIIQNSIKELRKTSERLKKKAPKYTAKIIDEVTAELEKEFYNLVIIEEIRNN